MTKSQIGADRRCAFGRERSSATWRAFALALVLVGTLSSCARPVQAPVPTPEAVGERPVDTRGASVFAIDSDASRVHILVYRGGTLARLGHNHVVTSRSVSGRAWLHPQFERSGFELSFPVESLIVDDPDARRAHGADFPPGISQKDIEGTRRNMLRPEVLNAQEFPTISVRSIDVKGALQSPSVMARITIKGVAREKPVPLTLTLEGARLKAKGELDVLQTEFGMKPFSIALGALEVQDRLHLEFEIVAERES